MMIGFMGTMMKNLQKEESRYDDERYVQEKIVIKNEVSNRVTDEKIKEYAINMLKKGMSVTDVAECIKDLTIREIEQLKDKI